MKKSLLATTALAALGAVAVSAPAVAQEKISISVGGYMQQWFGYGENDEAADREGFAQITDSEIHFKGETTLDNGLTFGVNVQLEGESQNGGDTIDEQFAYIEGSFGRFNIGDENAATYLMVQGLPSQGLGLDSGDAGDYIADGAGGSIFELATLNGNFARENNDSSKLTYFTPRFSGFQLGASYTPSQEQDDQQGEPNQNDGTLDDGFAIAANYVQSFGDFSVRAGIGYEYFGEDDQNDEDVEGYGASLRLGYAGFTLSGGYHLNEDRGQTAGRDVENYGVGLMYAAGPFGVSANYIYGEDEDNPAFAADVEQHAFELGAKYTLGPGVDARASFFYVDQEEGNTDTVDGFAVAGGIALSF